MNFAWHLRREDGLTTFIRRLILHWLRLPTFQSQLASIEILIKMQLAEVHATLVLYRRSCLVSFIILI